MDSTGFRAIVTGVDLHESSWEAALWAMRYFAPGAEHSLVHVVDLPELPAPLLRLSGTTEHIREAAREHALHRLEELRALGSCPHVHTYVREGKPAEEILRLAGEVGAALIVVGEQGPRRGIGALLGSTAERVLFHSSIPVLLARKVADSPPRGILAAVDATETSTRVLGRARALLERFDADLSVLHVVDRLLLADELTGLPTAQEFRRLSDEAVDAMQAWLEERVRGAGLPPERVQVKVAVGDPSYEIISEASRSRADLVLVGSRGDDVARTPLIGRVVNKVVRSAPCSVLVVTHAARAAGEG